MEALNKRSQVWHLGICGGDMGAGWEPVPCSAEDDYISHLKKKNKNSSFEMFELTEKYLMRFCMPFISYVVMV